MSHAEQDSRATATTRTVDLNDTKSFIQHVENHLLKSQFSKKHKPVIADIEQITQELYRDNERALEKLPEIKSKVKNIKKLLQDDLLSDGALIQNVPHSSRANLNSRGSLSKRSFAPS